MEKLKSNKSNRKTLDREKIQLRKKWSTFSLVSWSHHTVFLNSCMNFEFWMKTNFWLIFHSSFSFESVIAKSYFFIKSKLLFWSNIHILLMLRKANEWWVSISAQHTVLGQKINYIFWIKPIEMQFLRFLQCIKLNTSFLHFKV